MWSLVGLVLGNLLGGADISWIVGLVVPAVLFLLVSRRPAGPTGKTGVVPSAQAAPAP